jgi:lysophospholipase L1-like esterase
MKRNRLTSGFTLLFILWMFIGMRIEREAHIHTFRSMKESPLPDFTPYPFLNLEQNRIQYPGNGSNLNEFYERLEKLVFDGQGSVTIMHMGGSHVQAGTLSNRIRENLFELSPGIAGQRGFFFPFRLAKTNSPFNIKLEYSGNWEGCRNAVRSSDCDWGLSGVNATTADSIATVKLWSFRKDSSNYQFNSVKIYHPTNTPQMCIEFKKDAGVKSILQDSIGGYTQVQFETLKDTLEFTVVRRDSSEKSFTLQGIKYEIENSNGLSYQAIGVNGASVPSYLRCVDFEKHLSSNVPDLVIFGIGINDAYMTVSEFKKEEFKNNYRQLLNRLRTVNPKVNFLFLSNNDSYYKKKRANKNGNTVREAMIELCEEEDAAFYDLFEVMGGLNSVRLWENAGLAKRDKIHFTVDGYLLEADLLSHSIEQAFGNYLADKYPRITTNTELH